MTTTDTPRTDEKKWCAYCGAWGDHQSGYCVPFLRDREVTLTHQLADARLEVERLKGRTKKAEDLIKGLHDGWKKARKAHLETCKNAQREIDKLHAENVCLQELIQEFYEWSRRDYPTESEVREIMDRYYNLLNK